MERAIEESEATMTTEEQVKDLWNWIASNMTNPNDIKSIRMAQMFIAEFRKQMSDTLITKGAEEREKIKKLLTGTGGIEGNFCDWNAPKAWANNPTPAEVEKWVINKIDSLKGEV